MAPALSVVIPAYDEEGRIGATIEGVRAWIEGPDRQGAAYEIVVVDDGSSDGTAAVVQAAGREASHIRLVRLPHNRGKGAAVRAGMAEARGRLRLLADADLATPMDQFPRLEAAIRAGADVAIGSRGLPGSVLTARQPALREGLGRTFNLLVRALLLRDFRDTQCGFKLFTARAADALFPQCRLDGFAFDVEVLVLAARAGLSVSEVPVTWRHVPESKVDQVADSARMLSDLLALRLRLGRPSGAPRGPGPG